MESMGAEWTALVTQEGQPGCKLRPSKCRMQVHNATGRWTRGREDRWKNGEWKMEAGWEDGHLNRHWMGSGGFLEGLSMYSSCSPATPYLLPKQGWARVRQARHSPRLGHRI